MQRLYSLETCHLSAIHILFSLQYSDLQLLNSAVNLENAGPSDRAV
jgi:hypothetical protein